MVLGRKILMFYTTIVHIASVCGYKNLHFWANLQKYQTLVPAKTSHLKVVEICHLSDSHTVDQDIFAGKIFHL